MKNKLLRIYYLILVKLAHHYLVRTSPTVIWINGSVGKTSCRMIIFQTIQKLLPDTKIYTSPKNFNGELWLSLSVFQIENREPNIICFIKTLFISFFISFFSKKRYEILILEYGIDTPWEMDFILQVAKPDIGVFTAIDAVHSQQFWNPTEIAREEVKMALNTKNIVFLNADDDYAMQLLPKIKIDKLTYQTQNSNADLYFTDCSFITWEKSHEIQSSLTIFLKKEKIQVQTNLIGKANYGYMAVALSICEILGKKLEQNLTLDYTLQPGRLSIFAGKQNSIILDSTYNSAPRAVREIINTAIQIKHQIFPNRKLWLILGDMRELWDLTESEHRRLAGYVSQSADQLFLFGNYMTQFMADELDKCWFNKEKISIANTLSDLNQKIEKKLTQNNSEVFLVFKGSQNTIFLEESVKHFLNSASDKQFLTRQSKFWMEKK